MLLLPFSCATRRDTHKKKERKKEEQFRSVYKCDWKREGAYTRFHIMCAVRYVVVWEERE